MLGRSDIAGLYEVARFSSLSGFSNTITCAFFRCFGTHSTFRIALYIN